MNNNDLNQLFSSWGRAKRQNPSRDAELREACFSKLQQTDSGVLSEHRRLPWLSLSLSGLAVIMLFKSFWLDPMNVPLAGQAIEPDFSAREQVKQGYTESDATQDVIAPEASVGRDLGSMPNYYPYPGNQDLPITDTREFLKTYYNATFRTRQVEELGERIQHKIRAFDGRIDSANISEKYGYISFAIPETKFEAFRADIKRLVRAKFLDEDVRMENFLPQKQSIEERKNDAEKYLSDLRAERTALVVSHNQAASSIKSRMGSIAYELAALRSEVTTDPVRRAEIGSREQELMNEQKILNTRLVNENSSYAGKRNSLDANIKQYETNLNYIEKEDKTLLANVATVTGTVSLQWISVWDVVSLYLTPYWFPVALALAAVISYILHRRRKWVEIYA